MISWKSALPLLLVAALLIFEERVSTPSCEIIGDRDGESRKYGNSDEFKVMMVANLLLMGSEAGYMNIYFRDSYISKFFRKSFEKLKPDMLVVLGDVSAKGSELTNNKWLSVLQQFQRMLGPFLGLPLHVVLGDREVGECSKLEAKSVKQIASSLPGLDPAGCGSFEVSNISFVSLNAVALLCGNNDLRFSVESVIERESRGPRSHVKENEHDQEKKDLSDFYWRENALKAGAGPVLLLHFPLHRSSNHCRELKSIDRYAGRSVDETSRAFINRFIGNGPLEDLYTMPPNATEYIFQAIRPKIVFSAHTHGFCYHTHKDGTREITVPAMTWDVKDDPGFVVAAFRQNAAVTVSQCFLARESDVLMAYASVLALLIATTLMAAKSYLWNLV